MSDAYGYIPAIGGGILSDLTGGAISWGLANKSANRYKSSVRHLRRREYQDMMFSMKKAGLNPMLASGATPGHSASQMVQAPHFDLSGAGTNASNAMSLADQAKSKSRETKIKEDKKPAEVELIESTTEANRRGAELTDAKIDTEAETQENLKAQRALLREQKINAETVERERLKTEAAHSAAGIKQIDATVRKTEMETPEVYGNVANPVATIKAGAKEIAKEGKAFGSELYNSAKRLWKEWKRGAQLESDIMDNEVELYRRRGYKKKGSK